MTSPRPIFSRWIVPACLAVAGAGAHATAQEPVDLPALPDAPALVMTPAPAFVAPEAVAPPPVVAGAPTCTPGHCSHRSILARRRCKRHLQEVFLGFPEEFERPPLGAMLHDVNVAQVRKGEAAALTLRAYDFTAGSASLNTRGTDRLAAIASRLPVTFAPVIIERSGDMALDAKRREMVLDALADGAFPIPNQRVVIGPSPSHGLRGDEAVILHQGLLFRTETFGPPVATGTTSSAPAGIP